MGRIFKNILELVGNTPLIEIGRYAKIENWQARVLVKVEKFNPAGSIKDRIAIGMINNALQQGLLKKGGVIIEPTSGNTGIGLAMAARINDIRLILTMPESMSVERRKLLLAMGAELVLTPASEGMNGAIRRAQELQETIQGAIILGQFGNPSNPETHYRTTAQEIWNDTDGSVDMVVAGIGTGGTISGIGRYLKQQTSAIEMIGVEPKDSPVINGGKPGPHPIQGIGAGFIPLNYDASVVDHVYTCTGNDAISAARQLSATEGLLVGISSGAALWVGGEMAKDPANKNKTIVVILPDTGERYLSTALFE